MRTFDQLEFKYFHARSKRSGKSRGTYRGARHIRPIAVPAT
jgi:hypothetical protein